MLNYFKNKRLRIANEAAELEAKWQAKEVTRRAAWAIEEAARKQNLENWQLIGRELGKILVKARA